jgi:NAD(P)-dependent dehydrogenase (short-subunit alcohol dehydrogenase family)
MSKSLLPLLKTGGSGRIVNIGSSSFFRGPALQCHYVAAKAGVIGFSRSLANAVGQYGITVNVVTPGLTATPGAISVFDMEQLETRAKMRPIARVQIAEDVVGAVTFLASADAAFITGQIINVDGGVTMH